MNNNNLNKNVMKRKITTIFVIFCFLITNILYSRPVYAFTDINQFLGNVVDWADKVTKAVEGVAGGVLKSTLSTVLNQFAKDLGQQTVNNIANSGNGQEPLYFNLSLEDTLMAVADNAVGEWLDKIGTEKKLDLCKPIDVVDVNWKFKIMLNIVPNLNTQDASTKYNCTVSKFIESAKTSIGNMITSVQNTFGQECFADFLPKDISGAAMSLGSVTGVFNFDINGFKSLYGYDTSTVFCKKTTYYLKTSNLSSAINASLNTALSGVTINKDTFVNNDWTTSKSECIKYDNNLNLKLETLLKASSSFVTGMFKVNSGNCLLAIDYCKFDNSGAVIYDRAKRKSFIDQYNKCYVPKVKETIGGLLQLSGVSNNDDIANAEIKNRCTKNIEALFDLSLGASDPEKIKVIKKGLEYDKDNKFAFFVTKELSPLIYITGGYGNNLFISDTNEDGESNGQGTALFGNRLAVWKASSIEDFYKRVKDGFKLYDILYFGDPTRDDIVIAYNSNKKVIVLSLASFMSANFTDNVNYEGTMASSIENVNYEGTMASSTASYEINMNEKKSYMIELCNNINNMNTKAYIAAEEAADREKMEKAKAEADAEQEQARTVAMAEAPKSAGFKDITEPVSKQVVTPGSAVQNQFETSLNLGSNLLQPTGDLIIDPIKIFLSTILTEGSNALFRGLFENILPTAEYSAEDENLNLNEYLDGGVDSRCDNSNDPSKFSDYTPCGANYQCKSCCCTPNPVTNYGIMYCYPTEYCK